MSYAELHCLSNFTFLRGASHPEELVAQAQALGLAAIAVTDRNSLAGVVRAHVAAKQAGLQLIVGCRLELQGRVLRALAAPIRDVHHVRVALAVQHAGAGIVRRLDSTPVQSMQPVDEGSGGPERASHVGAHVHPMRRQGYCPHLRDGPRMGLRQASPACLLAAAV